MTKIEVFAKEELDIVLTPNELQFIHDVADDAMDRTPRRFIEEYIRVQKVIRAYLNKALSQEDDHMLNLTDDQEKVLEALAEGTYTEIKPSGTTATRYQTHSGIEFSWLHGLGDGKDVRIFDQKQSEGFAKKVRVALEQKNA